MSLLKVYKGESGCFWIDGSRYKVVDVDETHAMVMCETGDSRLVSIYYYKSHFFDTPSIDDVRTFDSGATRDSDKDKLDFDGFLCHDVLVSYAKYMHKHRHQSNGELRDSDNWKKGIPKEQYIKSMWRHFMDVWDSYSTVDTPTDDREAHLNALLFNVMGLLHEELKSR